jgi:hypothetical protein
VEKYIRTNVPNTQHDGVEGIGLLENITEQIPGVKKIMGLVFETPIIPKGTKGFAVEAKRWVVERTFAWLNFFTRVVMDYEHTSSATPFLTCSGAEA